MDTTWFEELLLIRSMHNPHDARTTGDFGYDTLPVSPLFHAFVDLDEKFTINLVLWDKIRCISSPTNQLCDAYWMEGPTQINLILSTCTRQIMARAHDKQKTHSVGDNTVARTYTSSIENPMDILKYFSYACTVCLGSTNFLCLGWELKQVNLLEMT